MKKLLSLSLISVLTLSACADGSGNQYGVTKSNVAGILGAAGGAALGNQFGKGNGKVAAVAAGTLLGALVGSEIGASLDRADMAYYNRTSQNALELNKAGQASTWRNPDSGNSGTITPSRTFRDAGNYCREYTQKINVGGRTEEAVGTACRQPDGSWRITE